MSEGILKEVDPMKESIEWATPIVAIAKSDGKIRLRGDFRITLNPYLAADTYMLPTFNEISMKIAGAKICSEIDLKNAYLQIGVDERTQKLLVISTPFGYFKYTRLPFGIKTAPSIFQGFMDDLLRKILGVSENEMEHMERVEELVNRLSGANIAVKNEKCVWAKGTIEFLGYRLDGNMIGPARTDE